MCGRVTITDPSLARVAAALEADPAPEAEALHRPRWNAGPGTLLCVVLDRQGQRLVVPARWGIPSRAGHVLSNRRVESWAGVRGSTAAKRCALPVDGFYEWFGPAKDRWPRWFHPREGGLLRLACVLGQTPDGPAFAILTQPASEPVSQIHDRMPAILPAELLGGWLAGNDVPLEPGPGGLLSWRDVSQRTNGIAFDGPECLEPPPPKPPSSKPGTKAQLQLF